MLETRGYRILGSLIPEEAIEVFRQGGIDLVLSDLTMPRMDGNELARRMKEITPEVPILLVSGSVKAYERATLRRLLSAQRRLLSARGARAVRMMLARKRGPKKGSFAGRVPAISRVNSTKSSGQGCRRSLPNFSSLAAGSLP